MTEPHTAPRPDAGARPPGAAFRTTLFALLFALAAMAFVHTLTYQPDADFSCDGPYHVGMADLLPQAALGKTFPWTRLSIWREVFYDKELGFHILLLSVRRWAGMFGYTGSPPFLLETFFLVTLWLGVFWWCLARLGVSRPALFLPAVLLLSPLFTDRINLVRPHVIAIALLLVVAALLCRPPARGGRLPWLFGLGFALAYFHSNPHFILLPTGLYALLRLRDDRWHALTVPAVAVAGVGAGLLIHPQFPNTFLLWKIQCIDVPLHFLHGSASDLSSPAEIFAPSFACLATNGLVFLPPLVVIVMLQRRRAWRDVGLPLQFFLLLSIVACVGFVLSKRAIEYAWPFSVILAALAYEEWTRQRSARFHVAVFAGVLALCLAFLPLQLRQFGAPRLPMPRPFAAWARANLPQGTYIANLYWEDFPRLFYTAPDYVYSCGLDSMFGYAAEGERYVRIDALCRGTAEFPAPGELKELLGTDLVFLYCNHAHTARRMAERGYSLAYQGLDGWVFNLAAPLVDHRLNPAAP
ncbi:MAG: hypothetical protein A3K19_22530 [Lentisphaerae bacterium RIFOXYB12_FULL_65_16]|nr:MAG: hypothetical protein A3K18_17505 [Lentisphaerae bacterium RIFOXYA12_64_32]OGV92898.1 MAG: hypothetical protein A3K19_22530 [Lentisphaerae bacterium RIFOXYB12_FULL_65_16]